MDSSLKRNITISVTESCNLNCSYCYESHKTKNMIRFEIAKKIIDKEMNLEDDCKEIVFELFGGEPFLAFDAIKEIVEYLENAYSNSSKLYSCFITTNGTLVHGEIQSWLLKHRNKVWCALSLDGPRHLHNLNRSNSFDDIDLEFFRTNYPYQPIKMTISQETLGHLSECVIFVQEYGFEVACNLAYGIDWSNPKNVSVLEMQLMKLIEYYIQNPNIKPCTMLSENIIRVIERENEAYRECGAGLNMRAYDINGIAYPCQFFMPVAVGQEKAKKSLCIDFHGDIIPKDRLDKRCIDCVIKSICHICYGSNYASTGNIYIHEENWCKLNKIIFKARAYFRVKQFEHGLLEGTEIAKKANLQSALKILNELY